VALHRLLFQIPVDMTMSHPLPDVRDGLSLVHRRVLLSMRDAGLVPGGSYKKSVVIVRDVFKRFRPRARDSACDALIAHWDAIIARRTSADRNSKQRIRLIKEDLLRIANLYGDRRRTEICDAS